MKSLFSILVFVLLTSVAMATMKKHVGVQGVLGCLTAPSHEIKATIELGYKVGTTPTILGTLNVDNVNYCGLPTLEPGKDSRDHSASVEPYTGFSFKQSFSAAQQSQIIIQDMASGSFKIEGQWSATVKDGQPFVKITHHCPMGKDEKPLTKPRVIEVDIDPSYIHETDKTKFLLISFDIGMINLRAKYRGD